VCHSAAVRVSNDRRAVNQQALLWGHDPRTFDGVRGSAAVGRRRSRSLLSAVLEGTHAATDCRVGQERSKVLDYTEGVLLTRVAAGGHRASTRSTCCCRSCPFSAASPAREARVAEMRSAVLQKLEAHAAVVSCKVRPFDGCLVPGPLVVAAAVGAVNSVAACPESWQVPTGSTTCFDAASAPRAASDPDRAQEGIGGRDSTEVDRIVCVRASRDTGRRSAEHVMHRADRAAARLRWLLSAGKMAC
jgi:hypothetical protein